jgi:5-oxoprolinase (ATP-hydrolysing) subunit A
VAQRAGHAVIAEGFPDRGYAPDGSLARRGTPGALIHDADEAAARAVRMAVDGTVEAIDGTVVEVRPGSLCIHGDNPGSVATARAIRAALERADVVVRAF